MSESAKGLMLLPPAEGLCPVCATDHSPELPHNRQSLYYQMAFKIEHGRYPTWNDAWEHCTPKVRTLWKDALLEKFPDQAKHIVEETEVTP